MTDNSAAITPSTFHVSTGAATGSASFPHQSSQPSATHLLAPPPPSSSGDFQIRRNGPPRHPTKPASKLVWPDWFRKVWELTEPPASEDTQQKLHALFFDSVQRRQQERGSTESTSTLSTHAAAKLSLSGRPAAPNSAQIIPAAKSMRKPNSSNSLSGAVVAGTSAAQKTAGKSSSLQGAPKPKVAKTTATTAFPSSGKTPIIRLDDVSTQNSGTVPAESVAVVEEYSGEAAIKSPEGNLSDDEDLLGLTCCKCKNLDATDGNALLECSTCQTMYHQLCHEPPITYIDPRSLFYCAKCQQR